MSAKPAQKQSGTKYVTTTDGTGVVVTYTNQAEINKSIVGTAERNRKKFELEKNKLAKEQLAVGATGEDYGLTAANQNNRPTPLQLRIKESAAKPNNILKLKSASLGTIIISSIALLFWTLGLIIYGVGLAGIAIELALSWLPDFMQNWLGNPGLSLFMISYFLLTFFGLSVLVVLSVLYYFTYKPAFTGYNGIALLLAISFYCAPLGNFLPWFLLWTPMVQFDLNVKKFVA